MKRITTVFVSILLLLGAPLTKVEASTGWKEPTKKFLLEFADGKQDAVTYYYQHKYNGFTLYDLDKDGTPEVFLYQYIRGLHEGFHEITTSFEVYAYDKSQGEMVNEGTYYTDRGLIVPSHPNVSGLFYEGLTDFGVGYGEQAPFEYNQIIKTTELDEYGNSIQEKPYLKVDDIDGGYRYTKYSGGSQEFISYEGAKNALAGKELVTHAFTSANVNKVVNNYNANTISMKTIQNPLNRANLELGLGSGVVGIKTKPAATSAKPVERQGKVKLNNKDLLLDLPMIKKSNRNFYPFRELLELANVEIEWNAEEAVATGTRTKGGKNYVVEFPIGQLFYTVNGETVDLAEVEVTFLNSSRTYIPVRYALEGLGFTVDWNAETETIIITD